MSALFAAAAAQAETLVAYNENTRELIAFDSATPGTLAGRVAVSGITASQYVSGLDYRAADSTLYATVVMSVGSCQLHTVTPATGALTAVGAAFACVESFNDVDVDPVTDNVRILAGTKNYQVDAATGVRSDDTDLAYGLGDPNVGTVPDVRESAYDQNTSSATASTLFAIDEATASLVRVGSVDGTPDAASSGKLTTIGALGSGAAGGPFDISGTTPNTAYLFDYELPFTAGVNGKLYTVDLTTGAATLVGKIGTESFNALGMTVAPGVTVGSGTGGGGAGFSDDGGALPPALLGLLMLAGLARRRSRD